MGKSLNQLIREYLDRLAGSDDAERDVAELRQLSRKSRGRPRVKVGLSRQVVIPKNIHDKLGLAPGDYLEVEVERGRVVMTPKILVDKKIAKRLAEGLEDLHAGRSHGPFDSAKEAIRFLHAEAKRRKKTKAS